MDLETLQLQYYCKDCNTITDESTLHEYAVTFNICNNEYINGKKWGNYTKHQQQGQLLRRLKSYCKAVDARIQLENFVFETSPKTGQQHIHCIVDSSYNIDGCEWSETINKKFTTRGYSAFLVEPIRNREAWQKYLKKTLVPTVTHSLNALWTRIKQTGNANSQTDNPELEDSNNSEESSKNAE